MLVVACGSAAVTQSTPKNANGLQFSAVGTSKNVAANLAGATSTPATSVAMATGAAVSLQPPALAPA
jgi:hypothetical protein